MVDPQKVLTSCGVTAHGQKKNRTVNCRTAPGTAKYSFGTETCKMMIFHVFKFFGKRKPTMNVLNRNSSEFDFNVLRWSIKRSPQQIRILVTASKLKLNNAHDGLFRNEFWSYDGTAT